MKGHAVGTGGGGDAAGAQGTFGDEGDLQRRVSIAGGQSGTERCSAAAYYEDIGVAACCSDFLEHGTPTFRHKPDKSTPIYLE